MGVARQYCGRLGKVANCQAGMFLAYVSPLGRALVDKGLYLPESWTSDKDRCEAAGVPEDRQGYRSKTELALEMVGRAQERGHLKAGWVAFGMSPSFREGLAALGMWYVLDVPSGAAGACLEVRSIRDSGVPANPGCETVSAGPWSSAATSSEAGRLRWPREARGHAATFSGPEGATDQQALSTGPCGRQRTPLLPVQCSGGYPVETLAYVGGSRWLETEFETEKRTFYETRTWAGWHQWPPAGRSFSAEPATGLGEKDAPDHEAAGLPGGAGNAAPGTVRANRVAAVA